MIQLRIDAEHLGIPRAPERLPFLALIAPTTKTAFPYEGRATERLYGSEWALEAYDPCIKHAHSCMMYAVYPSRICTMQHGAHMHAGSDAASTSPCVQFRTSPAPRAATPAPRAPRVSTTRRRARMQPLPWQRLGVGPARMLAARGTATCHPHKKSSSTHTRPAAVLEAIRRCAPVRPLPLRCASVVLQ